jgi:hypothetical protein
MGQDRFFAINIALHPDGNAIGIFWRLAKDNAIKCRMITKAYYSFRLVAKVQTRYPNL